MMASNKLLFNPSTTDFLLLDTSQFDSLSVLNVMQFGYNFDFMSFSEDHVKTVFHKINSLSFSGFSKNPI